MGRRVVIVGAGISGLSCAMHLSKLDFTEITILEADSEIGGRIKSVSLLSGQEVDIGASWFHSAVVNPIYDISKQFEDVKSIPPSKGKNKMKFHFTNFTKEELKLLEELGGTDMTNKIFDAFYGKVERINGSDKNDVSYAELMKDLIKSRPKLKALLSNEIIYRLFHFDFEGVSRFEGGSLEDLSVKFNEDEVADNNDDYFVSTFGLFLRNYRNLLPSNIQIRLNSKVTQIDQSNDNIVKIKLSNGEEIECDKVVVTVSLGILKSKLIEFIPPLPQLKQTVIEETGFGLLNKIFLEFPESFWGPYNRINIINRPNSSIPFDLITELDRDYCSYIKKNNNNETDSGDDTEEFIEMLKNKLNFAIWSLEEELGKPILLTFVPLPYAERAEQLSDSQMIDICIHHLSLAYPDVSIDQLTPTSHVITRWKSHEFTRGSYTFRMLNCPGLYYDVLAEPFENVHFAGEHTDRLRIGYSQGAYLTGIREADLIAESYSL